LIFTIKQGLRPSCLWQFTPLKTTTKKAQPQKEQSEFAYRLNLLFKKKDDYISKTNSLPPQTPPRFYAKKKTQEFCHLFYRCSSNLG